MSLPTRILGRSAVSAALLSVVAAAALAAGSDAAPRGAAASGLTIPAAGTTFAEYQSVPLLGADGPAYKGPATPHSLTRVTLPASLKRELKLVPGLGPLLARQGFAAVPSGSSLFQAEYEGNIYGGFPVYVTTDTAYNAWHLAFDKILRDLEQKELLPKLETLVTKLVADSARLAKEAAHTPAAGDASRAAQLYQVAAAELGLHVSLGPLAKAEKRLIDAHTSSSTRSPLLGVPVDYSLFTPRGHYTLTPALTRFFEGMSVLGQLAFCLPGTAGCPGLEPTRIGLIASIPFSTVAGDGDVDELWHEVYDPTAFLVGRSDDYSPGELMDAVSKVLIRWVGAPTAFQSDATVTKIVKTLVSTRQVEIDPNRASVRIMGTRFTVDEYLLDQLVFPHVGTTAKPRLVPSGLDLAAAFGSTAAEKALAASGSSAYAHYGSQLAEVQKAVATRPATDWGSTVYDAWLAALQPAFAPHGKAFPDYMRTAAWSAKDLQSGLGSYTELKHDTILFAKQLVAEAGGDPVLTTPLNWVEPDPVVFERLASAADLLEQGLSKRKLLSAEAGGLLSTEIDLFRFLGRVATGELANEQLATADNLRLKRIGDELSAIWWRTSDRSRPNPSIPDQSALVADIASSARGVVTLATGQVETLYVIVPDGKGGFELARGGLYSTYEFTTPPGQRLTDDGWRALLERKPYPVRPGWQAIFRVPCPGGSRACSPTYVPG